MVMRAHRHLCQIRIVDSPTLGLCACAHRGGELGDDEVRLWRMAGVRSSGSSWLGGQKPGQDTTAGSRTLNLTWLSVQVLTLTADILFQHLPPFLTTSLASDAQPFLGTSETGLPFSFQAGWMLSVSSSRVNRQQQRWS